MDRTQDSHLGFAALDRRLVEVAILRNRFREWMWLPDEDLFRISSWNDHVPEALWKRIEADCKRYGTFPASPANCYSMAGGSAHVYGHLRELRTTLRVIRSISQRMPEQMRSSSSTTGYTIMSEAPRNALEGDEKLASLNAQK